MIENKITQEQEKKAKLLNKKKCKILSQPRMRFNSRTELERWVDYMKQDINEKDLKEKLILGYIKKIDNNNKIKQKAKIIKNNNEKKNNNDNDGDENSETEDMNELDDKFHYREILNKNHLGEYFQYKSHLNEKIKQLLVDKKLLTFCRNQNINLKNLTHDKYIYNNIIKKSNSQNDIFKKNKLYFKGASQHALELALYKENQGLSDQQFLKLLNTPTTNKNYNFDTKINLENALKTNKNNNINNNEYKKISKINLNKFKNRRVYSTSVLKHRDRNKKKNNYFCYFDEITQTKKEKMSSLIKNELSSSLLNDYINKYENDNDMLTNSSLYFTTKMCRDYLKPLSNNIKYDKKDLSKKLNYLKNVINNRNEELELETIKTYDSNNGNKCSKINLKEQIPQQKNVNNRFSVNWSNYVVIDNKIYPKEDIKTISEKILKKCNFYHSKSQKSQDELIEGNGKLMFTCGLTVNDFSRKYHL